MSQSTGKKIFNSISKKTNLKSFRLTKNGVSTGVFKKNNDEEINIGQERNNMIGQDDEN